MRILDSLMNAISPVAVPKSTVHGMIGMFVSGEPTDAALRAVCDRVGDIITKAETKRVDELVRQFDNAAQVFNSHGQAEQAAEANRRRADAAEASGAGKQLPAGGDIALEFASRRRAAHDKLSSVGGEAIALWCTVVERVLPRIDAAVQGMLKSEAELAAAVGVGLVHSSGTLALASAPERLRRDLKKFRNSPGPRAMSPLTLFAPLGHGPAPAPRVPAPEPARIAAPEETVPPPPPRIDPSEALKRKEAFKRELHAKGIIKLGGGAQ